jgi:hypothetical protein
VPRDRSLKIARMRDQGWGHVEGTKNTIDRVENAGLAERVLVLGSRVTPVVTALRAANAVVGVSLIRLLRGGS